MVNPKKLWDLANTQLESGEEIKHWVIGSYETKILGQDSVRTGILLATDKRIIFYAKKLTGFDIEVFPYSNISSIEAGKNMMGPYISFFASGNKARLKWIKKGDVSAFVSFAKESIGKKDSNNDTADNSNDSIDQLKKLAELKEQGIVTDEEFAAKKKQLLGI